MTLKELLFKNKKPLFFYILGVLFTSGNSILFTLSVSNAFNIFTMKDISELPRIFLISLAYGIAPIILQLTSRFLRIGFMTEILKEVRLLAYQKIMNQDYEAFHKHTREGYHSQLTSDINLFEKDFFLSVLNIGFVFFSTLIGLGVLMSISVRIALISLITTLVLFALTKIFENPVRQKQKEAQTQNEVFNKSISNVVKGSMVIKHYEAESEFLNKTSKDIGLLEKIKGGYTLLNKAQLSINQWIASISQMGMFVYTAYLLAQKQIDLPKLIIVLNSYSQIVWGMISGFSFVNRLKASIDIYNRLVLDETKIEAPKTTQFDLDYSIENLSFAYDDYLVLNQLNFKIPKNKKVLIYGPSGSGKTTLLNLLAKNLTQYDGSIHLGDVKLNEIDTPTFLEYASYVRQSHFIFDDTIRNNIILNQEYDEAKFNDVLEKSALKSWLDELDEKDNHMLINNGHNISGGQRQRISFARELYRDSQFIFFDEPSASLDDENAKIIYDTILNLKQTVICVTHRHIDYLESKFDLVILSQQFKEGLS